MPCMYELQWKYVNSVVVVRSHFFNKSKNINPSTVILLIRTTAITTFNYGLVRSIVWSTTVKPHYGLLRLVWPNLNAGGAVCKNRNHVHFVLSILPGTLLSSFSTLFVQWKWLDFPLIVYNSWSQSYVFKHNNFVFIFSYWTTSITTCTIASKLVLWTK